MPFELMLTGFSGISGVVEWNRLKPYCTSLET